MFVLGFQEIVPLTAQQIIQTDPEKKYVFISALGSEPVSVLDGIYLQGDPLD